MAKVANVEHVYFQKCFNDVCEDILLPECHEINSLNLDSYEFEIEGFNFVMLASPIQIEEEGECAQICLQDKECVLNYVFEESGDLFCNHYM